MIGWCAQSLRVSVLGTKLRSFISGHLPRHYLLELFASSSDLIHAAGFSNIGAMPPAKLNQVSSAGITVDAVTGEHYIPSSLRADGSKRREIRVRPGYRPPEDVEIYRTRAAEAWKNRAKAGVPGAEGLTNDDERTGKGGSSSTTSNNKNAKRREARRKAKATDADAGETTNTNREARATKNERDVKAIDNWRSFAANGDGNNNKKKSENQPQPTEKQEEPVDLEAEKEKKARNLKKKLRQARELSDKKDKGESLLPEQLEKVIKIQELIRQLESLGFDSNGEKKAPTEENEKAKA